MRGMMTLSAALLLAGPVLAQVTVDEHTTLLAHFDRSAAPDYCAGDWRAAYSGEAELVPGKFGKALSLAERKALSYAAEGKINADAGTIEFWLKCTWEPGTVPDLHILSFRTPTECYVNFNSISRIKNTQLGMAVQGGPADAHVWRRVGLDPSDWAGGEWYHLAAVWEDTVLEFYVNGELVDEVTDAAAMVDTPAELTLGPGPLVIDELRISNVARSPEEIMMSASTEPQMARSTYLTDLEPSASEQAMGKVGIDAQSAIDDRAMPLAIGKTAYARGVAIRAPGHVEFKLPAGLARLTGQAGASAFGGEGRAVVLAISADGDQVFSTAPMTPGAEAQAIDIPVAGVKTLRLEATPVRDDAAGAVAIFADPLLLPEGATAPPPFAREMPDEEITLQRMRTRVAEFEFALPDAPKGYVIYPGHPVDMIDVTAEPFAEPFPKRMRTAAAPGEYEAVQFILCAAQDLPKVEVSCSELRGPGGVIPQASVDVRLVRRVLQRRGYWMNRDPENYETISRFLFPNRAFWLPAGNLKEVHIIVHVPDDAAPGEYEGIIRVAPQGAEPTEFTLAMKVLPIKLVQPQDKRYGMYYRFTNLMDKPEVLDAELADLAAHGCTTVISGAGVQFSKQEDGAITWDLSQVQALLEAMREHGGFGPITVHDNVDKLGRLLGHAGLSKEGGAPLAEQQDVLDIARQAFADLAKLNAEYPEFEVLLTHMDEVFGRDRLPRYMDIAEVVRKTTDLRIYITMHTMPGRWEDFMEQSDPYIDIRCMNGHAFEEWLKAGHTFEEMGEMLKASGDEGWMYHNMRGSFFRPEWNRIINGVYWWMSPLVAHVPWMYYSYGGDPFDDTDSERYDFGYAFPSPDDPTQLTSTLHWEAFREGYDDMRYIATLEDAIRRAEAKGVKADKAKTWLEELRGMMPRIPEDIMDIELESPLCVAISEKFSGADYDRMRWHTAQEIIELEKAVEG